MNNDDFFEISEWLKQKGVYNYQVSSLLLFYLIEFSLTTERLEVHKMGMSDEFLLKYFNINKLKVSSKDVTYKISSIKHARYSLIKQRLIQVIYIRHLTKGFPFFNTHYYMFNEKLIEEIVKHKINWATHFYEAEFDGLHKTWKDIKLNKEVQMKQAKLEIDSNDKDMKNLQKMNKALSKENEHLKAKIQKLEEKLKKAGKLPTIVKYTIDNYGPELEKEKEILNRFNVPIWSISELCKRLVKVLEGDNFQNPLMTKQRLNKYFDLILQFNLQEYRQIPYAPKIYSDAMLFEKYEQIVDCLQKIKPLKPKQQASDVEKKQKEYDKQYREYLRKSKVLENTKIEDDEDEKLDESLLSDND
ncbi:MAG: hypothetical protein IJ122_06410 [Methanobrevibacter sp.]|nr:hypothetical protein [Methanobrevibacter sp.]